MELGYEINQAISSLVTEILAPLKLTRDEDARLGGNIGQAMKKLAIALIEKARESTPK